jgi:hypothetical protein
MSKKDEINQEETKEDQKIMRAVTKASRPSRGVYHMVLLSGDEIDVPFHLCSHAVALQAQKGEKFIDTDEDEIDPDRNIRLWIKKVNAGLEDGWRIINDLMTAPNPPKGDLAAKKIPVSEVTTEDWAMLETLLFPGSELNRKTMRERANTIFGKR